MSNIMTQALPLSTPFLFTVRPTADVRYRLYEDMLSVTHDKAGLFSTSRTTTMFLLTPWLQGFFLKCPWGWQDVLPPCSSSSHVTYGLPFVILCLDSYKRGWEGKGTPSRHTSIWPSVWWRTIPNLSIIWLALTYCISGSKASTNTAWDLLMKQVDRGRCVLHICCWPSTTQSYHPQTTSVVSDLTLITSFNFTTPHSHNCSLKPSGTSAWERDQFSFSSCPVN